MATMTLSIKDKMKEELLNNWRAGDVYLVVYYQNTIISSKKITFGSATSTTTGSKIEWIPSGTSGDNGSDFEIPVGTEINGLALLSEATQISSANNYGISTAISETFTYGGIVRVSKLTITLT